MSWERRERESVCVCLCEREVEIYALPENIRASLGSHLECAAILPLH